MNRTQPDLWPSGHRSLQANVASFHGGLGFYPERMLDLGGIDAEEIVTALADQLTVSTDG